MIVKFSSFFLIQLLQYVSALHNPAQNVSMVMTWTTPRDLMNIDPKNWQELGEGVRGTDGDLTGHRVASNLKGNIIAISSPKYIRPRDKSSNGVYRENNPSGRVQSFKFDPGTDKWIKYGRDIVGEQLDELGTSLAMDASGNNIVVGMINDNGSKRDAGTVRVYIYDDNSGEAIWVQKGPSLVGEFGFEHFGAAVGISNDGRTVAIGAPLKDAKNPTTEEWEKEAGVVRVYNYEPGTSKWVKMGGDIIGEDKFDHFGAALSLSGNGRMLVVGAPHSLEYQKGKVSAFRYSVTEADWQTTGEVEGSRFGEQFGASVSLSMDGKSFIAGSPYHDVFFEDSYVKKGGSARAFKFQDSKWLMLGQTIFSNIEGHNLGASVAISKDGSRIAVGSPNSFQHGRSSGHTTVYALDGELWSLTGLEIDGKNALDMMGCDVALSGVGDIVVVGAQGGGYAEIYAFSATESPTMAPTSTPRMSNGNGAPRFATIFSLVIGVSIITVIGTARALVYVREKNSRANPVPSTDLELRDEAGVI